MPEGIKEILGGMVVFCFVIVLIAQLKFFKLYTLRLVNLLSVIYASVDDLKSKVDELK